MDALEVRLHTRIPCLLAGFAVATGQVGEARRIVQEREVEFADGAVALLGDDDFGSALEFGIVLLRSLRGR